MGELAACLAPGEKSRAIDRSFDIDEGEAAAIALARELNADRILIDERDGRRIAGELGLRVAGTLAVLRDAASADLISLPECFARLKSTTFRASDALYEAILAEFMEDRGTSNSQ